MGIFGSKNAGDWGKEAAQMIAKDTASNRLSLIKNAVDYGYLGSSWSRGTCFRCKNKAQVRTANLGSGTVMRACQACITEATK